MTGPRRKSGPHGPGLTSPHAAYLEQRAVPPAVAKERGYRTVTANAALAEFGFGRYVPVPGFLLPVMWKKEPVLHQFHPDRPRPEEGKVVKFERPKGLGNRLDCHPRMTPNLADPSVPLFITEGIPKGDALAGVGLCAIALLGVDCWTGTRPDGTKGVLPDWDDVALGGRAVYLAYDSDAMTKGGVAHARRKITDHLNARGSVVKWVYLPGGEDKVGIDDYLAADHTAEDLFALARPPRSSIVATGRQLPGLTREALEALAAMNEPPVVFQRLDELVEARKVGVTELKRDRLRYRLAEAADWYRRTKDALIPVSPPGDVVDNVAVASDLWPFPPLDRIVTTPVFAADGSLRSEPGYHAPSRSLYVPPPGLQIPPVRDHPTRKDVARAQEYIDDLLCDFAFVDEADRAHAWALLLQPFARELLRGYTPLYGVEAHRQGTGKTALVHTALAPAIGEVQSFSEPHGDEEMEKRLTASFMAAEPVVFFDNVTRPVQYPSLSTALTKGHWQGRVLGQSQTVQVPINCTWAMTANNPQYDDDMARRVARIRLDTKLEDPHRHSDFRHSLPADALAMRGELIWAACTLIRAWVLRGRRGPGGDVPKLVSYGPWRRVLGGVLALHGVPGFLGNLPDPESDQPSPEQEFLEFLLAVVNGSLGGRPFKTVDVLPYVENEPEMAAIISYGGSRETFSGRLGKFMRSHNGQRVRGHVLRRASRSSMGVVWEFAAVDRA